MAGDVPDLGELLKLLVQDIQHKLQANLSEETALDDVSGLRVVRGRDWRFDDQDKGEGYVGTVLKLDEKKGWVIVLWDHGKGYNYRAGLDGKHDLRIYDNGTVGESDKWTAFDTSPRPSPLFPFLLLLLLLPSALSSSVLSPPWREERGFQ
jgi:Mib_herc2